MAEWVKCGTLMWFGHVLRMHEDDLVQRVCESKIEENDIGGDHRDSGPIVSMSINWRDALAGKGLMFGERLPEERKLDFCCGHPLGRSSLEGTVPEI